MLVTRHYVETLTLIYLQVYGGTNVTAVDHLCLGIPKGECFGLLGINGNELVLLTKALYLLLFCYCVLCFFFIFFIFFLFFVCMFCYLYLALTEISIYRYRVENIAKTKLTRAQNPSKCDSLTKRQNSASYTRDSHARHTRK